LKCKKAEKTIQNGTVLNQGSCVWRMTKLEKVYGRHSVMLHAYGLPHMYIHLVSATRSKCNLHRKLGREHRNTRTVLRKIRLKLMSEARKASLSPAILGTCEDPGTKD
jgi:hypothetical protein